MSARKYKKIWFQYWRRLSRQTNRAARVFRWFSLSGLKFFQEEGHLRASALTFYSLLAIVPLFAMLFGIAKGFGFDHFVESELSKHFTGQEEVLQWLIHFSNSLLENTQGGVVAGVSILLLFWSVIKVFGHIEAALNKVWHVGKGRQIVRRFNDYLSLMLICPVIFIASNSVALLIVRYAHMVSTELGVATYIGPGLSVISTLVPALTLGLMIAWMYVAIPNTKVQWPGALAGGLVAGLGIQLVQWSLIHLQVGVTRMSAVYGGFVALPLFMVWLQFSWIIFIMGAHMAYIKQYQVRNYWEVEPRHLSVWSQLALALEITWLSIHQMADNQQPATLAQFKARIGVAPNCIESTLKKLCDEGILVKTEWDKEVAYHSVHSPDHLTVRMVMDALLKGRTALFSVPEEWQDNLKDMLTVLEEERLDTLLVEVKSGALSK